MEPVPPRRAQSSSATWGANGASTWRKARTVARLADGAFWSAFVKIIIWEMAVLRRSVSMSSPTFRIVSWSSLRSSGESADASGESLGLTSPSRSRHSRQTFWRKRCTPSMPLGFHGFMASSGPRNIR